MFFFHAGSSRHRSAILRGCTPVPQWGLEMAGVLARSYPGPGLLVFRLVCVMVLGSALRLAAESAFRDWTAFPFQWASLLV